MGVVLEMECMQASLYSESERIKQDESTSLLGTRAKSFGFFHVDNENFAG